MDSITLHVSQFPAIDLMSLEQKGGLLDCLMQYAMTGEKPGVDAHDPMVVMAFTFVVDRMRTDERMAEVERTAAMNEQNRRNGTKGGRPKKPTANTENNLEKGGFENKKGVFENENPVFDEEKETEKDKEKRTEETPAPLEDKKKEKEKEKEREAAAAAESSVPSSGSNAEAEANGADRESYGRRDGGARPRIGFLALQRYWNGKVDETGSPMTKLDSIRGSREKLVADRLLEHGGDMDAIRTVIDKAMGSSYLNGTNPRGWVGSFDWLMEQDHFTRVKEGRYDQLYAARQPQGYGAHHVQPSSAPSTISVQMEQLKHTAGRDIAREKTQGDADRYMRLVKTVRENPRSLCRGALVAAYEAGILAKLGINWQP